MSTGKNVEGSYPHKGLFRRLKTSALWVKTISPELIFWDKNFQNQRSPAPRAHLCTIRTYTFLVLITYCQFLYLSLCLESVCSSQLLQLTRTETEFLPVSLSGASNWQSGWSVDHHQTCCCLLEQTVDTLEQTVDKCFNQTVGSCFTVWTVKAIVSLLIFSNCVFSYFKMPW